MSTRHIRERTYAAATRLEEALPDDDRDEYAAPPLHGKSHPPGDMGFVVPATDDDIRDHHVDTAEFDVDPDAADAAADLAGDMGAQFLEGATRGEDVSERAMSADDESQTDVPFVLEIDPLARTRRYRQRA